MKAILFDIDGTLINSNGAGKKALRDAFYNETGFDLYNEDFDFHGKTDRDILNRIMSNLSSDSFDIEKIKSDYIKNLNITVKETKGYVLPGVIELLNILCKREDIVLGLLTGNMYEGARVKLEYFDLFQYFPFGVFGDTYDDRNKLAFFAKERLEHLYDFYFDYDNIVVIGDTGSDIICGRSIDAKTLAVATGNHTVDMLNEYSPDVVCENLEDISYILQNIL